MSTDIAKTNGTNGVGAAVMELTLLQGDLSRLNAQQRVEYMTAVCNSLGLNPLTKPFEFLNLNNKLVMYAKRDCTEQLRKIHGVSINIVSREFIGDDLYVVTARATDARGRTDESIGAVPIAGLKGEAKANALMKAETKAKRRATLSICGLGMLDESEVDSVQGAMVVPTPAYTPPKAEPSGRSSSTPTASSASSAKPSDAKPASSTDVGSSDTAGDAGDDEEFQSTLTSEYTEPVPVYNPETGEQIRTEPGITSAQLKHIHALRDEMRNDRTMQEESYRKRLKKSFCKEHTNELSISEASRVIDWALRKKAKQDDKLARAHGEAEQGAIVRGPS